MIFFLKNLEVDNRLLSKILCIRLKSVDVKLKTYVKFILTILIEDRAFERCLKENNQYSITRGGMIREIIC
jgi:hypothetical protein